MTQTLPPVAPAPADLPQRLRQRKGDSRYAHVTQTEADYENGVVKSARRTIEVLEFLAEVNRPATAMEIAINIGLPQSSASMLLRSLVSLGYLDHCNTTRAYRPTLRLPLLGMGQSAQVAVAQDMLALMHHLHDETGDCVILAEQYQSFVRYIYVLQSKHLDLPYVPLGTLRPACSTAFGLALLACQSDPRVRSIIHRARSDRSASTYGLSMEQVVNAIGRSRELDYAFTRRGTDCDCFYQLATVVSAPSAEHRLAIGVIGNGDEFCDRSTGILKRIFERTGRQDRQITEMAPAIEIELPGMTCYVESHS